MSFVGPSGSGKTTLLNLIGGLDVPTSGDIYFKESGLSSMSRQQMAQYRRENIGFIFQTYNLLPVYSVYENVLFPLLLKGSKEKNVRDRVMDIVEKVGLSDQSKKKTFAVIRRTMPACCYRKGFGQRSPFNSG